MKFWYLVLFSLIPFISGGKVPDLFKSEENLVDKVVTDVEQVGETVADAVVNPVVKVVEDVDKAVLGGDNGELNKAIFKVENGVVQGLAEVVGEPVNLEDVKFYLATSKNHKNPDKVDYDDPSDVAETSGHIFFIIHGWTAHITDSWVVDLTEVLLRKYPTAHVVQVDWSRPAGDAYPFSAFNTESVGEILASLSRKLVSDHNVPTENIVLIGHSLGGQIAGWTGRKFHKFTGDKLSMIVGLDPAGPLFCLRPENRRLNKHDAERVMVIHTDGGELGFLDPCGTVDFFPNGGSDQPGCAKINVIDLASYLNPVSCDHIRSYHYLIEAVNSSKAFPSRKCKTYSDFMLNMSCESDQAYMGFLHETSEGSFYLKTAPKRRFSLPLILHEITSGDTKGKQETVITSQKNDSVPPQGGTIVIEIPDKNDAKPSVPSGSGDTVIKVDEGTTAKTIVIDVPDKKPKTEEGSITIKVEGGNTETTTKSDD
ncbi:pancreatic triacylglycerol lipase-like isoform X2 [Harmonia axyridis]|uniref:pancreatic triacylglycerol lipase-like isoform X2 n=1 Tax=Harmonia axyridis TaxID=115357 RepID=UPI001E2770B6|nr:pancreatic triacylglycerol lipase-like isoform X2 [Harmonia axyridis]